MKQSKFIRKCGPYTVTSISQDGAGVRLIVYPRFPQYDVVIKNRTDKESIDPSWIADPRWPSHRYKGEGGGPGIFTAIALAKEFEEFLNQPYTEAQVADWKELLAVALKKINDRIKKRFDRAMERRANKQMDKVNRAMDGE